MNLMIRYCLDIQILRDGVHAPWVDLTLKGGCGMPRFLCDMRFQCQPWSDGHRPSMGLGSKGRIMALALPQTGWMTLGT